MAVSSSGQNDGQVQVVSCASGDVLDVVAKEDLVGKDGRTAKKLIAGVLGDVPYTRICCFQVMATMCAMTSK